MEINMTPEQYEQLFNTGGLVLAEHLINKNPRTLLYGYNLARDTWHVYLGNDGVIHTVKYEYKGEPQEVEVTVNEDYIPSKRLYPEACDAEFCTLLMKNQINLPFTTFSSERPPAQFYAETLAGTGA